MVSPQGQFGDDRTKLVVIGDSSVGKTTLIQALMGDSVPGDYKATIGTQIDEKTVSGTSGEELRLQIWDLGGQPAFKAI